MDEFTNENGFQSSHIDMRLNDLLQRPYLNINNHFRLVIYN